MDENRSGRRRAAVLATAVVVFVAGLFAAGQAGLLDLGDDASLRPPESFDNTGFAIWPEDTASAGLRACREHADEEPWRLSPEGTAERFALDVFGYDQVDLGDNFDSRAGHYRVLVYYPYDSTGDDLDLGNVLYLLQYDRCWFVQRVDWREGGPAADHILHRDDRGALLELRFPPYFEGPAFPAIEAGYAGRSRRVVNRRSMRVRTVPGQTGHYLIGGQSDGEHAVTALGGPLPVAPNLNADMTPVRHGGFALYPESDEQRAQKDCRFAGHDGLFDRRARVPLISFAMVELREATSSRAPEIETARLGRSSVWVMRTPAVTLHINTTRTSNGCVMITDITTPGTPVDVEVSVSREWARVEWGKVAADRVDVEVAFEYACCGSLSVKPNASPLYIPRDVKPGSDGFYVVMLRDRRGRLLAVEGHALAGPRSFGSGR